MYETLGMNFSCENETNERQHQKHLYECNSIQVIELNISSFQRKHHIIFVPSVEKLMFRRKQSLCSVTEE